MAKSSEPPGVFFTLILFLLAGGAIFCGGDAIISKSTTTPSLHGGSTLVDGIDALFVGIGWLLIGAGFINRAVASHLKISGERWITLCFCITGGIFWGLVFL
jgi:hypothetical protein